MITLPNKVLLSEFTNISYQGYLNSKSFNIHNHRLLIWNADAINYLQEIGFAINVPMLDFVVKYQNELTDLDIVYVSDKWLAPYKEAK
jgi:hypothetical protein